MEVDNSDLRLPRRFAKALDPVAHCPIKSDQMSWTAPIVEGMEQKDMSAPTKSQRITLNWYAEVFFSEKLQKHYFQRKNAGLVMSEPECLALVLSDQEIEERNRSQQVEQPVQHRVVQPPVFFEFP
ncbi:hypothetical protein B9Z55_008890 [Caenorhabditis nigoni]|uniref:Uncharacterized protein n=1 Tax=Caenorhabditis nigoni TaxID=1611254 RepID=A0A2G5UPW9_9PELO|nr:hypothetical protein B9Z55_008890 [Caenorhabditis nigoni]